MMIPSSPWRKFGVAPNAAGCPARAPRRWCGPLALIGMGAALFAWAAPARAQLPSPPGGSPSEADPFTCWWKTDTHAVHVGERFRLVLTCAAAETGRITAVPDLAPLEPASLRIPPFDVISGTSPQDIRRAPWRYVQREYVVRVLGDGFFGRDVELPSVVVPYAVHSAGGTEGRGQAYALPPLPLHVLALVPQKATDIEEAPSDTFAAIEAREQRATNELVAAAILLSVAAVIVGLAGARALRRRFDDAPAKTATPVSPRGLLGGCVQGIGSLQSEVVREGWTAERASRALTMLRVAGAVALGRPVMQTLEADPRVAVREGQLELQTGVFRRRRVLVSAPTTPVTIARRMAGGQDAAGGAPIGQALEALRASLDVFDRARYGRDGILDPAALDVALDAGAGAVRRVRSLSPRSPRSRAAATMRTGSFGGRG